MTRVLVWAGREGTPERREMVYDLQDGELEFVAVRAFKKRFGIMPNGLENAPSDDPPKAMRSS